MASDIQIANLALGHLAIGKTIASLTENSSEARACNLFFDISREATLRDFPWPFASKIETLGLVESAPNSEWDYSYRYPSDCLMFHRILSGSRNDSRQTRVPYKISQDSTGKLIFTDAEDAVCEYTVNADNPGMYAPDFSIALSYRLAAFIAPRLMGGDNFKMGIQAMQLYEATISRAKASALNEEQPDELPDSEFITGRE